MFSAAFSPIAPTEANTADRLWNLTWKLTPFSIV
jgi:hypothetical protein